MRQDLTKKQKVLKILKSEGWNDKRYDLMMEVLSHETLDLMMEDLNIDEINPQLDLNMELELVYRKGV